MREFLKVLENDFNLISIDEEVSTKYEVSKILRDHTRDVVVFRNIKESEMGIISGNMQLKRKNCQIHFFKCCRHNLQDCGSN